jgi:hypothetical protein
VCARRRTDLDALRELHAEEMEAVTRENSMLKVALLEHLEAEEIDALIPPSGERRLTAASVADVEGQVASALMLGLQAELASVKAQADALALVAAAGVYTRSRIASNGGKRVNSAIRELSAAVNDDG